MKKYLKIALASGLITILLTGCGSGLSEEEKNQIEKFEIKWSAHLELADLAYAEMENLEKRIHENHPDPVNDSLPDDAKAKYELLSITKIKDLKAEYLQFISSVKKPNQQWQELKSKAMKDDVEYSGLESEITGLQEILMRNEKKISGWMKTLDKLRKAEK